ncbi:MAG: enoyl-CoA hydratase/isomerase family protein [Thermoprotei archaeon]
MQNFTRVQYIVENKIGWILLNRPEKLNALDEETWKELHYISEFANNDNTQVVVITGTGRAFSAGDDILAMYSLNNINEAYKFFHTLLDTVLSLINMKKPLIAAVNGLAYGGGCELLLLADVVISVQDAKFAIPEGRIGLIPPIALSVGHNMIGLRHIARLILTGEPIDVYEAQRIGLVDYIVPNSQLKDKTIEIAQKIMLNGTQAIKTMRSWLSKYRIEFIKDAIEELAKISITKEAKEGMKAFLEKRKLKF